jgi:hypothetical protein
MHKRRDRSRTATLAAAAHDAVVQERSEHGVGRLEVTGQPSLRLPYRVDIDVRRRHDGRGQSHCTRRVVGRVVPTESWTLVPYVGAATLVLEDGRRWECRVVDIDGQLVNDGAVAPFD